MKLKIFLEKSFNIEFQKEFSKFFQKQSSAQKSKMFFPYTKVSVLRFQFLMRKISRTFLKKIKPTSRTPSMTNSIDFMNNTLKMSFKLIKGSYLRESSCRMKSERNLSQQLSKFSWILIQKWKKEWLLKHSTWSSIILTNVLLCCSYLLI